MQILILLCDFLLFWSGKVTLVLCSNQITRWKITYILNASIIGIPAAPFPFNNCLWYPSLTARLNDALFSFR